MMEGRVTLHVQHVAVTYGIPNFPRHHPIAGIAKAGMRIKRAWVAAAHAGKGG